MKPALARELKTLYAQGYSILWLAKYAGISSKEALETVKVVAKDGYVRIA